MNRMLQFGSAYLQSATDQNHVSKKVSNKERSKTKRNKHEYSIFNVKSREYALIGDEKAEHSTIGFPTLFLSTSMLETEQARRSQRLQKLWDKYSSYDAIPL